MMMTMMTMMTFLSLSMMMASPMVAATSASSSLASTFTPTRVSFQSLLEEDHATTKGSSNNAFWNALRDVGLVSITDVPSLHKQELFEQLEACLSEETTTTAAQRHIFSDGTRRRTLATRTLAGHAEALVENTNNQHDDDYTNCLVSLQEQSQSFRQAVDQVTAAVADRLGVILGQDSTEQHPLYLLEDGVEKDRHYTIDQIIQKGEHLEHFHCYDYNNNEDGNNEESNTIDWHTDQGLMLVFAPGQQRGKATDGFYIQLKDGSAVELDLNTETDDLIVMLGDGVNQYVNPKLPKESFTRLRAVPHALKMKKPSHTQAPPRMWYGRMVLPPPTAMHPSSTTKTFAQMRSSMIDGNQKALSLGCASNRQVARELADGEHEHDDDEEKVVEEEEEEIISCSNATSSYCWHQCMNFTDFEDTSPEDCESRSLSLGCVNDEGFLWTDKHHNPAFQLGCVNLSIAEFVADPPETEEDVESETNGDHDGENCHTHGDVVHCDGDETKTSAGLSLAAWV